MAILPSSSYKMIKSMLILYPISQYEHHLLPFFSKLAVLYFKHIWS